MGICFSNLEFASRTLEIWNQTDEAFIKDERNQVRRIYSVQFNKIYGYRSRTPSQLAIRHPTYDMVYFDERIRW